MKNFVSENSIVREIWGKSDTVLFIFAGASAEFALNKAVDWLFFTGRLPADPLGRLFSTVAYASEIVFASNTEALRAIHKINSIHSGVEEKRNASIPDWAYRDVLYMLIGYSISAFEVLERKLSEAEKDEVFDVFKRVGLEMEITQLPETYKQWMEERAKHLKDDLEFSEFTAKLYEQYQKHLGPLRYWLLLQVQSLVCPLRVRSLLQLTRHPVIPPALHGFKISRKLKLDQFLKSLFLPPEYKAQIKALDRFS